MSNLKIRLNSFRKLSRAITTISLQPLLLGLLQVSWTVFIHVVIFDSVIMAEIIAGNEASEHLAHVPYAVYHEIREKLTR